MAWRQQWREEEGENHGYRAAKSASEGMRISISIIGIGITRSGAIENSIGISISRAGNDINNNISIISSARSAAAKSISRAWHLQQ